MSKHPRKYDEKKPFYLGSPSTPIIKKAALPEVKQVIVKKKKSMIPPSSKPGQINVEADVKALYPEGCKYDPYVKDPSEKFASGDPNRTALKKADRSDPSEKFASENLNRAVVKTADRSDPSEMFASEDPNRAAVKKAHRADPFEKFAFEDLNRSAVKKADRSDPSEKFASEDPNRAAVKKAHRADPFEKFAFEDLNRSAVKKAGRSDPSEKFVSEDPNRTAVKKAHRADPFEKFAFEDLNRSAVKKADRSVVSYESKYFSKADQESMEEALKLVDELAKLEMAEKESEKAAAAKKELLEKEKADRKGKVVGGILNWNDYFMSLSLLSAGRSKDPNTKVGACIVNEENKIISMGYNGMPNGIADEDLPWTKKDLDVLNTKYPYVCHAEMNAIMNKNTANLKGCIMYTTRYPCNECAKLIVQSGIVMVVYGTDISTNTAANIAASFAALRIFELAGIHTVEYKPDRASIHIDFESLTMTLE